MLFTEAKYHWKKIHFWEGMYFISLIFFFFLKFVLIALCDLQLLSV